MEGLPLEKRNKHYWYFLLLTADSNPYWSMLTCNSSAVALIHFPSHSYYLVRGPQQWVNEQSQKPNHRAFCLNAPWSCPIAGPLLRCLFLKRCSTCVFHGPCKIIWWLPTIYKAISRLIDHHSRITTITHQWFPVGYTMMGKWSFQCSLGCDEFTYFWNLL